MVERVRQPGFHTGPVVTLARWVGIGALVLVGAAACSSDDPKTAVRGEVVSRDDLGGPSPAVAEFRAGERSVYGPSATP